MIRAIARAVGFFSRLPMPQSAFSPADPPLSQSAPLFPAAGVVVALPASVVLALASLLGLPALLAATLGIVVLIVTTGALHEDGLADVTDGFFGGADPARRLEIMKDSSIGSYGALALVAAFLLRVGAVAAILETTGTWGAVAALLASAAASRAALAWNWACLPSARPDGVAGRAGQPTAKQATGALVAAAAIFVVLVLPFAGISGIIVPAILAAATVAGFQGLCTARIGGQTGDTLGAGQQLAEIALLTGLVTAL